MSLVKICPRCHKLIPYGRTYCQPCSEAVKAQQKKRMEESKKKANRKYNSKRDPSFTAFYNSKEWKVLRAKYEQDKQHRCENCGAVAAEVHHKKAISTAEGWDRRLDYENLELLCTACHNERHSRFTKKGSKTL